LAGIPLSSGFIGKFAVFKAAGQGGAIPLVIVGVITSGIAAYFYVRVIVMMFFTDPPDDAPEVVPPSAISVAVVGLTLLITIALGVFPEPLLNLAESAARFTS
jgi:NADH-quinone oxidoreductase subunit N